MHLSEILREVPGTSVTGDPAAAIRGLAYDSRRVEPGFLFAALRGQKSDGLEFVAAARAKGAVAVLSSRPPAAGHAGLTWVRADNERRALALMARNYYGRPDARLDIVGVTGTNGKTTVTYLLEAILGEAGLKPCLLGTVVNRFGRDESRAERTTPESLDLYRLLDRFATAGARTAVLEVSSHALTLERVAGIKFGAAVFTNLTRDHLDFHGTMEAYLETKAILFRGLGPDAVAVLNADDPASAAFRAATKARVVTWGEGDGADVRIEAIEATRRGTTVTLAIGAEVGPAGALRMMIGSPLLGALNAKNIAAAAAAALAMGVPPSAVTRAMARAKGAPGRFDPVDEGQPFLVLVDYAHTDDALVNLLGAVRALGPRRVITVFGCGGDRDRSKRPLMGFAAASASDIVVVTSDNPRTEDPRAIIEMILPGVRRAFGGSDAAPLPADRCHVEPDRRAAIAKALGLAGAGDTVVIAGKGHETYQILGERTVPFDDRLVTRDLLRAAAAGTGNAPAGGATGAR